MKKILYIVCISLILVGCDNWLELDPIGSKVEANYIKDLRSAVYAYNGVDNSFINIWKSLPTFVEALADDVFIPATNGTDAADMIAVDQLNITESTGTNFFGTCYSGINKINTALPYIEKLEVLENDKASLNVVRGQMHFMKAFFYFTLVRLYGEVPIMSKVTNPDEGKQPRASMGDLYELIEREIKTAIELLPEKLNGKIGQEIGKPSRYSAYALQADFYAYFEKWDNVLVATEPFIGNEAFDKVDYKYIFHWESPESGLDYSDKYVKEIILDANFDEFGKQNITWEFTPRGYVSSMTQGSHRGIMYATSNVLDPKETESPSKGSYTSGLLELFEEGDYRLSYLWKDTFYQTKDLYGTLKFYGSTIGYNTGRVNMPVYRFSEILLLRAEALNEKNKPEDALEIVNNNIRKPMNASLVTTIEQDAVKELIINERRRELCFEGKRFFDLNRQGRLAIALESQENIQGRNITPHLITNPLTNKKHFVLPFPLKEINANPYIENNPGY